MKAGRRAAGSRAALTHSASIVGSDDVFDAALRRAGVVRVRQFTQLFSGRAVPGLALSARGPAAGHRQQRRRPRRAGGRLDERGRPRRGAARRADGAGAVPAAGRGRQLDGVVDLGEDASGEQYRAALRACLDDRAVDGVLLIHSPKADGDPTAVAQAVAGAFSPRGKPVLACWMGEATTRAGRSDLAGAALPSFRTPEAAVDAFHSIASFHRNQQLLQQTPPPLSSWPRPNRGRAPADRGRAGRAAPGMLRICRSRFAVGLYT